MKKTIKDYFEQNILIKQKIIHEQIDLIEQAVLTIIDCFKKDGKLIVFGNGGSASDAEHFAAEFIGRFKLERNPLPAIALSTNTSAITAIANDYGFENIFLRQLKALGHSNDVVFGISTSGKSLNVIQAMSYAKDHKMKTIALTGLPGKPLSDLANISIVIPSKETPLIQEAHIVILHLICQLVEERLSEYHV